MSTHLHSLAIFALLCLWILSAEAQERPITWGNIPRTDLEMKSFPGDTNASAVILCDYGESYFNDELDLVHERHTRIKILNPKGYEWGTVSIRVWSEDNTERLEMVKGATYVLDSTGTVKVSELDADDIFKKQTSASLTSHKFTLPGLRPGCVIEYTFRISSKSFYSMRDWVFQHSEPVRWSEYRIRTPRAIAYTAVLQGYERYQISTQREITQVFQPPARGYLGSSGIVDCLEHRYACQNLPALRDEPFITTLGDYANKVDLQLSGYAFVGSGVRRVLENWPKLITGLLESTSFGDMIDVTGDVEDVVEEITKGLETPEERLKAIYSWVSSSIVWDGTHRIFATQDNDELIESKRGNNAEITFLLLSMLEAAGIEGRALLLSTRSNGKVQNLYPILNQFNYVLARATIGTKHYYLDATESRRPMELLPPKVLNVQALVIQPDKEEWVTLSASAKSVKRAMATVRLQNDGSAQANIGISFEDYANVIVREDLKKQTDIEFAKEVLNDDLEDFTVDSALVENRDDHTKPLILKSWISIPSFTVSSGDFLYVNPTILFRIKANPFRERIRNFPVDYSYGREHTLTATLILPEGFELKERFPDRTLGIFKDIRFTRSLGEDGGSIRFTSDFTVSTVTFDPSAYTRLREFYASVVAAHSDQLVLKKKAPLTPPTTSKSRLK